MKNLRTVALVACLSPLAGCYTLTHHVGNGAAPTKSTETSERQWYVLWGIVPLGKVDSHAMAAGAKDYTITSQWSFLDCIINIVAGCVTVNCQSVTVSK